MTHIGLDTIGADAANIPLHTPTVGVYTTGSSDIRWTQAQIDLFHGSGIERFIQDNDPDPMLGDVYDVEFHAGTITKAVVFITRRRKMGRPGGVYLSEANLSTLESALAHAGEDEYYVHLANWNLNEQEATKRLGRRIVAVQFASPTSNPHMLVPGSHRTLAQANIDVSVCADSFFPPNPAHHPLHNVANASVSVNLSNDQITIHGTRGDFRPSRRTDVRAFRIEFDAHSGVWQGDPTE